MKRRGFTIIELVVVLATIAVIVSIAAFSFGRYQAQARDTQRDSDMVVLTEALERYYDRNGEYPGCTAMSGGSVATILDIDPAVTIAPLGTTTNSLQCAAITAGSRNDRYGYIGDGTSTCNTGASCTRWTLQYHSEETAQVRTITSRRQ